MIYTERQKILDRETQRLSDSAKLLEAMRVGYQQHGIPARRERVAEKLSISQAYDQTLIGSAMRGYNAVMQAKRRATRECIYCGTHTINIDNCGNCGAGREKT